MIPNKCDGSITFLRLRRFNAGLSFVVGWVLVKFSRVLGLCLVVVDNPVDTIPFMIHHKFPVLNEHHNYSEKKERKHAVYFILIGIITYQSHTTKIEFIALNKDYPDYACRLVLWSL